MRQELIEPASAPAAGELAEDVREVRQRWDAVLRASARQAVQRRGALRRLMRAGDEVVLAPEGHVAQLLLADKMPRPRLCRVGELARFPVTDRGCAALDDAA